MTAPEENKLIEVEYRDNNRIQIIRINSMTRDAVDAFADVVEREMIAREDNLLLSVQDYTNAGGIVSPYFLGRMKVFSRPEYQRADLVGRVAVVNSMDIFRHLLNPLMRVISRGGHQLELKFFSDIDHAIAWVSEYEPIKDPE